MDGIGPNGSGLAGVRLVSASKLVKKSRKINRGSSLVLKVDSSTC